MGQLSYQLHKLTARLDRAADQVLQSEVGITYPRFLALFAVRQGAQSQRGLAIWLGVTEPSVSRMTAVLAANDLLEVSSPPGGGHRRHLRLTATGAEVVERSIQALEHRFVRLVADSGVDYDHYEALTVRLIETMEADGIGPLTEGAQP